MASRTVEALQAAEERLPSSPELAEERAWLAAAGRRVEQQALGLQTVMARATALPELEAERKAKGQALFEAWVDAAEQLLVGISSALSANSPLIEALFAQQKLERWRRGGNAARAAMAELERRRHTGYVVRLSGEPEYAFLRPLLARFDEAKSALDAHEQPCTLTPSQLDDLRCSVFVTADALRNALHQARLLADAALNSYPGWLGELGLYARPKKKAARNAASNADNA